MKKIISALIFGVLLLGLVSAWGATRTISNGNNVTVVIDETGGTGTFTVQETVSGSSIMSYPSMCGLAGNVLTCDSDDSTKRVINYITSGSGSVSGNIVGGFPSTSKSITGDSSLGISIPGCTQNWSCSSWSSCTGGSQTRTCTDLSSCGNSTGKPSETQTCSIPGASDSDDLMVNYLRGKITIDGVAAGSTIQYKVEVLSGANANYTYYGSVDDSKVYVAKTGNGYFDTGDNVKFSTNDQFKVTITNKNCMSGGSVEGAFINGGNGDLNNESSLIALNCISPPAVNNAPNLNQISDVTVEETQLVKIIANATDAEGGALTYSINDLRFNKTQQANSGAVFEWQTGYSDSGTYDVLVSVTDGNQSDSQTVTVVVNDFNLIPSIYIPDQNILEDSGANYAYINSSDSDGTIKAFNILEENASQVDCDTIYTDSLLKFTPAKDFFGTSYCRVEVVDNKGGRNSTLVRIDVANVNDAPEISSYSPMYNPLLSEDGTQTFSVVIKSDDGPLPINVSWYQNGELKNIGNSYTFYGEGNSSKYVINVVVSDGVLTTSHTWNLTTSKVPITSKYDGETTNFTGMNDSQLACVPLVLEKVGYGKIRWIDCIDMRNVVDLDKFTDIQKGLAGVDSAAFPSFSGKRAEISFPGLSFSKIPTIYYNTAFTTSSSSFTQVCSSSICSDISYISAQLNFDVSGFSTFKAGDTRTCAEQGGVICKAAETCKGNSITARDTDKCCASQCEISFTDIPSCSLKNSSIKIDFNDPDDGDEFEVGDLIEGELNIENDLGDDQKFSVNVYLYDLGEQDKVDSFKKKISVDEGEDEDMDFTLEIPEDLEEGTYYLIANVEDDACNQEYITIDVETKEHHIILDDVKMNTKTVYPGSKVEGYAYVKNLGSNDEDVYLKAESPELNASQKTGTFEVDEGDKEHEYFSLSIPSNAKEGVYRFILSAISSESTDSEELEFNVVRSGVVYTDSGKAPSSGSLIVLTNSGEGSTTTSSPSSGNSGAYVLGPSSSSSGSGGNTRVLSSSSNTQRLVKVEESDKSAIRVNFQKDTGRESAVYVGVAPESDKVIYVQEKSKSRSEGNYVEKTLRFLTGKTYEISQRMLLLIDLIIAVGILLLVTAIVAWKRR